MGKVTAKGAMLLELALPIDKLNSEQLANPAHNE